MTGDKALNQLLKTEWQRQFCCALVYFVMGLLGTSLAIPPGYATPFWPASGFALAVFLVFGFRFWPAILFGSLLSHSVLHPELARLWSLHLPIAVAAVGQAMLGAWLIKRFVGFPNTLNKASSIIWFFVLGGVIASLLSATVGSTSLYLSGLIHYREIGFEFTNCFVGNVLGVQILTPLFLVLFAKPRIDWKKKASVLVPSAVVVLVFFIAGFILLSQWEERRVKLQLQTLAEKFSVGFQVVLDSNGNPLYSTRAFFESSSDVTPEEFSTFANYQFNRYPSVKDLEVVTVVRSPGGAIAYPVTHTALYEENSTRIGENIGTRALAKKALEKSLRTNSVVATPAFYRESSSGRVLSLLLFYPLSGTQVAVASVDYKEIIDEVLALVSLAKFGFLLTSKADDASEILVFKRASSVHDSTEELDELLKYPNEFYDEIVEAFGREWRLRAYTDSYGMNAENNSPFWIYLLAAVSFIVIFICSLMVLIGRRGELEKSESNLAKLTEQLEHQVQKRTEELEKQKRDFEDIFHQSPALILYKDDKNNILRANRAVADSLGVKPEDLTGVPTNRFYDDALSEKYRKDDLEVIESGRPKLGYIEEYGDPLGAKHFVRTYKVPFCHESRGERGVLVFAFDVTEEVKTSQRVDQLARIMELSSDFVAVLDPKTKNLVYGNNSFCEFLNKEISASSQTSFDELQPAWASKVLREEAIPSAIQNGIWRGRTAIIAEDGQEVPTDQMVLSIKDTNGKLEFLATTMSDLREIEEAHARSFTASKLASLGEMAGGIAHEINNPLTIIIGRLSQIKRSLQEKPLSVERVESSIDSASETAFRMARIVRGLLAFSRDDQEEEIVSCSANEIIEESLDLCSPKISSRSIHVECSGELKVNMICRRVALSQVLVNIISNSARASEGIENPWIHIEVIESSSKGNIQLRVSNNGPLIPKEIREKIFEPFFTTRAVGEGTGLGLSISKGLVRAMGGSLYLDETAKCTTFVIELKSSAESASQSTQA